MGADEVPDGLQIEIGPTSRQQKDTTFGAAAKRRVIILASSKFKGYLCPHLGYRGACGQ